MIESFLKYIYKFICGGAPQEPVQQPPPHQQQSQQQQYQPHQQHQQHQQHQPPRPSRPEQPHKPQQHQDQNQVNQDNDYYTSLRARANEEGDKMAKCFEESHQAYSRGDGASAKELSNKGKEHKNKMEQLNKQASDWIFTENNKDSKHGEIDLHGLYVKEAIARTDKALQEAKARGDSELRLIVGKGLHSRGAAKIKPAIEDLMQKHQLVAQLDENNSGVLVVQINAAGRNRGVGSDEISRRIEREDEGCVIM